jgi:cupin 2 domain-containing protein
MKRGSLFSEVPEGALPNELVQILWHTPNVGVQRIVSHGHTSPAGHWYDQDTDEWVLLVTGRAGLRVEGQEEILEMGPGDYMLLPAHVRHRVEWTDPERDSVWLTIHVRR